VAQTGRKAIVLRRAVIPAGESGLPTIEESGAGYSDEAREFVSSRSIEIVVRECPSRPLVEDGIAE
jgi:hypothetical protein